MYINSPLTATLQNRFNKSLSTIDIALPVYHQKITIGHAVFDADPFLKEILILNAEFVPQPFDRVSGDDSIQGEFLYQLANANDTITQNFLTHFIRSGVTLPLSVKGDPASRPFTFLQSVTEGVTPSTSVTGLYEEPARYSAPIKPQD